MIARWGLDHVEKRAHATMLSLLAALLAVCATVQAARADDGYDSAFARSVRTATEQYRLAIWARADGYIQSTQAMAGIGAMYTNHDDFNPGDLAHPTVLVFNEAGQLVACGYQFARAVPPGADFSTVPATAWYDIPRHLHYNITVGDKEYFAQAAWDDDAQPTASELIKRGLMPADATLVFAFVHPQTRALLVWAWAPNANGLFSGENATQP